MKQFLLKSLSLLLAFSIAGQIVLPMRVFALTTGPSQPEMQGFEPVGTTEMVDLFSGDFVYNLPLLDIDGYPINMAYHSGISMEQEASWIGLGWSLNPGEINRSVRGIPDDFNGDLIEKQLEIAPERNFRGKVGAQFKLEFLGYDPSKELEDALAIKTRADLSVYLNFNNYKGVSAGVRAGLQIGYGKKDGNGTGLSFAPSIGVGSQSGVDLDASMSVGYKKHARMNGESGGALGIGGGINSRVGASHLNFSAQAGKDAGGVALGSSAYYSVPIGIQNYVPVVTNAMKTVSYNAQVKVGGEIYTIYPDWYVGLSYTQSKFSSEGSRAAYGYMYLENAPENHTGILDFIRDKDGMYNNTMPYLPAASLGYDVYSISGQGTGGSFRPFRNDIGTVYDPVTSSRSDNKSVALEYGVGGLHELGGDVDWMDNMSVSGPWLTTKFAGEGSAGSMYEKLFFKQAGELTYNRPAANSPMYSAAAPLVPQGTYPSNPFDNPDGGEIRFNHSGNDYSVENALGFLGMEDERATRSNLITALTNERAQKPQFTYNNSGSANVIENYASPDSRSFTGISHDRQQNALKSRTGVFQQLQPDGRLYVYGLAAMNNKTRDIVYGAGEPADPALATGGVISVYGSMTPTSNAGAPSPEKFFSSTKTPAYAHAYMLTQVLSPDYVDITGNGCTDDDLGGFVKFNYQRRSADYRWRSPGYAADGSLGAQYDPGNLSDPDDGKASVSMGSREQWYISSIESKNLIAEFYTSPRLDGKGIPDDALTPGYQQADQNSYRLDEVRLYNKNERIIKGGSAIPIKTIYLKYDYSLCAGTPNSFTNPNNPAENPGRGKLTLKAVYIKYGASDKNLLNPYKFTYNQNPNYSYYNKDRWGTTDVVDQVAFNGVYRSDFPYTNQKAYQANPGPGTYDPSAYSMTKIELPSGGAIDVEYEPDDYAYVQDRRAAQMMKLEGIGTGTDFKAGSVLYEGDRQFDYVYFERDLAAEFDKGPNPDLKNVYLEGENTLYYSVFTELRAGRYEPIKGFAKVKSMGICTNNATYGYIELEQPASKDRAFNPIALYAMNYAKWNLSQILYPGYKASSVGDVLESLGQAFKEIGHMARPLENFIREGYCRQVDLKKSWLRLQSADLKKYGGGIRVKKLSITDNWNAMANSPVQSTGTFGKVYDYTVDDARYGRISSGVASYEPLIGGDENPLRRPAPYIAAENMALPAVELYQLEPIGECFFPGASVGYSSVKVRSIHADKGKSSMSQEEHLFYTSRDYPIRVVTAPIENKSFSKFRVIDQGIMAHATQGHSIYLNDMHGRPKAKNNYLITSFDNSVPAAPVIKSSRVSGIEYTYNEDAQGNLSNTVNAFHLAKEGGNLTCRLEPMQLGLESDLVFDSRNRQDVTETIGAAVNLNTVIFGPGAIPLPSLFPNYRKESTIFHSLAATKIFQQYGILKRIDVYEEQDSKTTTTENLVYDAESGNVLLSRTTNEFNDNEYTQNLPAYLAYEGMGPAYMNIGYKDVPSLFYVNRQFSGFMDVSQMENYCIGDELYLTEGNNQDKVFAIDKKVVSIAEYYALPTGTVTIVSGTQQPFLVDNGQINGQSFSDIWHVDISKSAQVNVNQAFDLKCGSCFGCVQCAVSQTSVSGVSNSPGRLFKTIFGTRSIWVPRPDICVDCGESQDIPTLKLEEITGSRCLIKVEPRYKNSHPLMSSTSNYWWSNHAPKFFAAPTTEIIRSGRRNLLGTMLQTTTSTTAANTDPGQLKPAHIGTTGLITASAQTFRDKTNRYKNFASALVPVNVSGSQQAGDVYEGLNEIVTGYSGTYRPSAQFTAFVDRSYAAGHSRVDGTFDIGNTSKIWDVVTGNNTCGPWKFLDKKSGSAVDLVWKTSSTVTKYDMYGNAVEEKDALGVMSTALYGFNKRLPVAVASNADQQSVLFESFEDMKSQALPAATTQLFYAYTAATTVSAIPSAYFSSPFVPYLFNTFAALYSGNSAHAGWLGISGTQNATVSTGNAHTGRTYLAIPSYSNLGIPARASSSTPSGDIEPFTMESGREYLVSVWMRKTPNMPAPVFQSTTLQPVGYPIEGWQLMQARVTPSVGGATQVMLTFPGAADIDDVRIMPVSANMKSFVYDYDHNNRLSAELDANHYATFYEYDPQGQLLRVKKETERGILTISENRSSLQKL